MQTLKLIVIVLTAAILPLPMMAAAASFDCSKARSRADKLICSDPELSKMDDDLGALYRQARAVASNPALFKKSNSDAWNLREKTCVDRACLVDWYQKRSAQLATVLNYAQSHAQGPLTTTPVGAANTSSAVAASPDADSNWTPYLVFGGVAWMFWAFKKRSRKPQPVIASTAGSASVVTENVKRNGRVRTREPDAKPRSGPRIPTVWIPPGGSAAVAGLTLPGGMVYIGSTLKSSDGGAEPGQIDPQLAVDSQPVDPAERLFGYWPRYDSISPQARRAYLTWLAGGRCDANANIGYVFLFYYGLERRVLVDAMNDPSAKAEIPQIVAETQRLQSIYGNGSFQRYSSDFIGFLETRAVEARSYRQKPPHETHSRGMPLRLRVGLGQSAVDGQPVSVEWALAWVKSDANIHLPTAVKRCVAQFDVQFRQVYLKQLGDGLRLAVNRTKLKISYRPASGGLLSQAFTSNIGDLPDITTVVTPVKKLQAIVDESAAGLEAYSRFIGRHADQAQSLEATLLLPRALWSESIRNAVDALDKRIGTGMIVIKLGELLAAFGGATSLTRDRLKSLFQVLQDQNVGVEPDVLSGAKAPKSDDTVVLFRLAADQVGVSPRANSGYAAVAVMLDLAITVANADGKISGREVQFLNRQVEAWSHVGASAQMRLRARLRLGIVYPPTLASLKSRVEPLPADTKAALAKLLSALALADGRLSPAAVKHLEKIYQVLRIDAAILYSQLHVASAAAEVKPAAVSKVDAKPGAVAVPAAAGVARTSSTPTPKTTQPISGFKLDTAKVAALQVETERVTALLSQVFAELEPTPVVAPPAAMDEPHEKDRTPRLLGLDPEHSAFLRILLTRPSWSRTELADIAGDMELMLDGALERVNEAALDAFDNRIAEGDEPIEIAQDLMESVTA
jgi:uncharacterized protein/uncharacterized tellurite resistance protein B-like protein